MPDKTISSSLRQLLQKGGDKLGIRKESREDYVKAAETLAKMSRGDATRNWGDQKKDK